MLAFDAGGDGKTAVVVGLSSFASELVVPSGSSCSFVAPELDAELGPELEPELEPGPEPEPELELELELELEPEVALVGSFLALSPQGVVAFLESLSDTIPATISMAFCIRKTYW
jgi:hypothetical protein